MADVFRRHGEAWRTANTGHVSLAQRRVMTAIEICRTAALGGHIERCQDCAHTRIAYNSCRNRHCPKCQWSTAERWLAAREAELLPVPYYHVVFTLPAAIGAIAYQDKAKLYGLLFSAAAEALSTIAADPKHLGVQIGVTAVLHTWGQNLDHHPHVHCIIPGGGVSQGGERWVHCRPDFFLPVRVLSRLFRRLFLEGLDTLHRAGELQFFTDLVGLKHAGAFSSHLAPLRIRQNGSFTPNGPSQGRRRFSPILPATPTVSPLPIAGCSISTTNTSAFAGRIIGRAAEPSTRSCAWPLASSSGASCCMSFRMASTGFATTACSPTAIVRTRSPSAASFSTHHRSRSSAALIAQANRRLVRAAVAA